MFKQDDLLLSTRDRNNRLSHDYLALDKPKELFYILSHSKGLAIVRLSKNSKEGCTCFRGWGFVRSHRGP
jgi:hypothetical protein